MTQQDLIIADGITSLTAGLNTDRDKAASVYYDQPTQDDQQLLAAYRTSWLARKIVEIPAFDTFRKWRSWQATDEQVEKIEAEEMRLDIKAKMMRCETMARLYGGAAIYFDLGDEASKPAPTKIRLGQIRFCTVLSHAQLSPGMLDQDPLSSTFGMPLWYTISGGKRGEVRIHPSRLIFRYGVTRLETSVLGAYESVWGDSVLYSLLPAIKQFDGTTANVASLIYESKVDVISVKGLMALVGDPVQERKLLDRYRLAAIAKGNNGMLILDGDSEEYSQKNSSFNALADLMDRFAQNASGGADIPMTRMFSQSPGGMNATGDSDIRNYYDRLSAHQELAIKPAMRNFDELMIQSALGSRPPEVHYIWSSLWQISETERAELGAKHASTIKTMVDTGLLQNEVLAESLVSMMVDSSVIPGLEASVEEWGMPDYEEDEALPDEEEEGGGGPTGGGKPQLRVVGDEQARAPKGSPIGGQWVKTGGGASGGTAYNPKAAAAASVATAKYSAEQIQALTTKAPGDLSHYEKKVLVKYKKALQAEQAKGKPTVEEKPKAPDLMEGYEAPVGASSIDALKAKAEAASEHYKDVAMNPGNYTNEEYTAAAANASNTEVEYYEAVLAEKNAEKAAAGPDLSKPQNVGEAEAMLALAESDLEKAAEGMDTAAYNKAKAVHAQAQKNYDDFANDDDSEFETFDLEGDDLLEWEPEDAPANTMTPDLDDNYNPIKNPGKSNDEAAVELANKYGIAKSSIVKIASSPESTLTPGELKVKADFNTLTGKNKVKMTEAAAIDSMIVKYGMSPESIKASVSKPDSQLLSGEVEMKKEFLEKTGQTSTAPASPLTQTPKTPALSVAEAKTKALASVATSAYPAAKIEALTTKNPKDLTQYEKKKLSAYKKALQTEVAASATASIAKPAGKMDPNTPTAQSVFKQIGQKHGMSADTVTKLATGEYQPDPKKPWQAETAASAKAFYETGVIPAPSYATPKPQASGPAKWGNQHGSGTIGAPSGELTLAHVNSKGYFDLEDGFKKDPPPISTTAVDQGALAHKATLEGNAYAKTKQYTGGAYTQINGALRSGGTHPSVKGIDAAFDASAGALTDMVVARGISKNGMAAILGSVGGKLKVGATIQDKGYVSTTRKASIADSFSGNGFGLKINVPKGSKILPVKHFSNYPHEDEFILPRGSKFKVTKIEGAIITVDLVAA